jgi:hypothetical protein
MICYHKHLMGMEMQEFSFVWLLAIVSVILYSSRDSWMCATGKGRTDDVLSTTSTVQL